MSRRLSVIASIVAFSVLAGPAMSAPEKQDPASQDDARSYLPPSMRQPGKKEAMNEPQDVRGRARPENGSAKKRAKTRYATSKPRRHYARAYGGGRGGGFLSSLFGN